ncbi:uncharacterized protein B0H18DRAFT_1019756 [Fomitopsis serialis]|uniref:uncharacterized protein n=1 Tax=Fomitopsis serialis TaxID=139415 RepID=UPI002008CF77|nr:uncharacterized protein B0H18DRAFT_1019756 [Neoantrodia serialis]KAH9921902.1 hypothetical protein B0H18DRAFT_1019756 [Neoantrodia serialis]
MQWPNWSVDARLFPSPPRMASQRPLRTSPAGSRRSRRTPSGMRGSHRHTPGPREPILP